MRLFVFCGIIRQSCSNIGHPVTFQDRAPNELEIDKNRRGKGMESCWEDGMG